MYIIKKKFEDTFNYNLKQHFYLSTVDFSKVFEISDSPEQFE